MGEQVKASSPYEGLDKRSYWRSGVVDSHPLKMPDLYRRKFELRADDKIATAGSCFAQHIARAMRGKGYEVLDVEPPPFGLAPEDVTAFGFSIYSARYGNIYTPRQLLQLMMEADGTWKPAEPVWMKDGRFYDALRPTVEPKGYESMAEYAAHRADHLSAVRRLFEEATLVVFTLGLTEAWVHRQTGTVYPTAPGTVAGTHDPSVFAFKNFDYLEVLRDLRRIRRRLKAKQPKVRMLVTVSPVPLTATASDQHVLAATTYSKSVLRAAAGTFASEHEDVDYFPSYEIIAGIQARGFFYENNLRSVASEGVKVVMSTFFDAHKLEGAKAAPKEEPAVPAVLAAPKPRASAARRGVSPLPILGAAPAAASTAAGKPQRAASPERDEEDVVCEDALLEAFAR